MPETSEKSEKRIFKAISPEGNLVEIEVEIPLEELKKILSERESQKKKESPKEGIFTGLGRVFSLIGQHWKWLLIFGLTMCLIILSIIYAPIIQEKIKTDQKTAAITAEYEARLEKERKERQETERKLEEVAAEERYFKQQYNEENEKNKDKCCEPAVLIGCIILFVILAIGKSFEDGEGLIGVIGYIVIYIVIGFILCLILHLIFKYSLISELIASSFGSTLLMLFIFLNKRKVSPDDYC